MISCGPGIFMLLYVPLFMIDNVKFIYSGFLIIEQTHLGWYYEGC
jgi:hypothetical protein